MQGFTAFFDEAYQAGDMLFRSVEEDTIDPKLMQGLYSKGFLDPCQAVVILPITPTTGHSVERNTALGFVVIGLNTRRPFDNDYQQFIKVLQRQLTTSMASVLLLEEEIRRGRTIAEQAALDQKLLEDKLRERTVELEARSLQLKHFTDSAGVGISVLEFAPEFPKGRYAYRNDKWWELTSGEKQVEENIPVGASFLWERIHKEDVEMTRQHWQNLLAHRMNYSLVFRISRTEAAEPDNEADWRWLLAYSLSVLDNDGQMTSVITSLTDITAQKLAESAQMRLASEAIEAKQQQENFIDVTSHEMRNPLSAIMISADDIITSLQPLESRYADLRETFRSAIDAAQIIADCAQHQRRIVDDILTISKLDSGLFSFTPVPCSVETVINNLLKMIEPELAAGGISRNLELDPSFQILDIEQVLIDPSRLLQILINLLTNAVKFTKYAQKRVIDIYLRASLERPASTMHGQEYLPKRQQRQAELSAKDNSREEKIFLEFSIEDTGKGLSAEEKNLLFQRFSQAPKTHVHYGGSGLGLFISRELVELQGGQIGVSSEGKDQGCNFSFYIEARRIGHVESSAVQANSNIMAINQAHSTYAIRSALDHDGMDIDLTTPGIDTPSSPPFFTNPSAIQHALLVEDNIVNVSFF
jgi:signal transduction histidine kinase